MAVVSISMTEGDRDKFLLRYSEYVKKAMEDGYNPYSQSKFFLEIFDFWLENKDKVNKNKEVLK